MLGKARGAKNGNRILTDYVDQEGGINFDMPYSLAYSGLSNNNLQKYVKDYEQIYEDHAKAEELPICKVGSVIGTHVGPGALAVAFFTNGGK